MLINDELIAVCPSCALLRELPHDWEDLIGAKAEALGLVWDGDIKCNDSHKMVVMNVLPADGIIAFTNNALLIQLINGKAFCVAHPWDMGDSPPGTVFCLCENCALLQRQALG